MGAALAVNGILALVMAGVMVLAVLRGIPLALGRSTTELSQTLRRMTPRDHLTAAAVIAGLILAIWLYKSSVTAAHMEIVRQQFHLPPGIEFAEFSSLKRHKGMSERIEAIVRFSEAGFKAYLGSLNDGRIWQQEPFEYEGRQISGPYEPDALQWSRQAMRPATAGRRLVRWGHLSREMEHPNNNRLFLCYAARREADGSAGAVEPCTGLPQSASTAVYVLAAIDYDTRSLHVIFN